LEISKKNLRRMLEAAPDAILIVDEDGIISFVNDRSETLFGYTENEIIGKSIEILLPSRFSYIHKIHRKDYFKAPKARPMGAGLELVSVRKDGAEFPVEISLSPMTIKDGTFVIAAIRDISTRRDIENKLRLQSVALNAAANAVVITDTNDVIQWVNPAFTQLTGFTEQETIGKTPKILRSDKHSLEFYRSMHETAHAGQVWKGEVINKRKDGNEYFEEQTITPVYDQSGAITHFIAIKQDITKRKLAEGKLLEKEKQMQALNDNLPNGYTYQLDFGIHGEIRQFIFIGAGVEKIFGISIQQIIDDPTCLSQQFLEEDNSKITEIENSAFATMTTFKAEARFIRENNQIGWLLLTSTPRKLANNHVVWDGIALDITEHKRAEFELQTALSRTKLLYNVASKAITSENLHILLHEIVQHVAQDLPANRASLIIFDIPLRKIKNFVRGGAGADQINLSIAFDELMEGLSGWAILTGQSALSPKNKPDSRESENVQKRRKETNCGSVLVTPLQYQGAILGTMTLINLPDEPDFTERDVELVEAVASQVSSAIVKVTLEDNLQYQNKYLTSLHQITLNLLNTREISDLLQFIVNQASEFLDAPFCEIMLYEGDDLIVKAYTANQSFLAEDRVGRDEARLSWQAFDTQLPAVVDDYSQWPHHRSIYDDVSIGPVLVLPILSGGASIGVLDISRSASGHRFDDFEIQAATLFAKLAALALENARLQEALRQEAIRDPLTGLFNRRFMQESLTKEVGQAERKSTRLSVVMLDLDHLKEINDMYGHSTGDEALRNLSALLKTKVRSGDIACRYGGDEFTLILSDTTLDSARQRMEEIRGELKQISIEHKGNSIKTLSLSIGIAEYPKHGATGYDLLKAADMALYQAKQAGRDMVMTA